MFTQSFNINRQQGYQNDSPEQIMIVIPLQTQFFGPNGFMSSGAFAAVTNEFVSVDSFFLIGDDHMATKYPT